MATSFEITPELLRDYVSETREILDRIDQGLVALESQPADAALINDLFREFHSVKGTSGFLAIAKMADLAHAAEDVLGAVRDDGLTVTPDHIDTLLVALDYLRSMLREIEAGADQPVSDVTGVIGLLRAVPSAAPPGAPVTDVREPSAGKPAVVLPAHPEPQPFAAPPPPLPPAPRLATPPAPRIVKPETTVRLDVRRLDAILALMGELLLERNRLQRTATRAARDLADASLAERLSSEATALAFVSDRLEEAILQTRMLPLDRAFSRLPRIVRDAARETGKDIAIHVEGEDTELDRALIEEIVDPLVHLVRNAVDHGIEPPDARLRAGKPPTGTIRITAHHEGNRVVIAIADDGAGIDPNRVCIRAAERGYITRAVAERLSPREALDLIFHPGFTTREEANALSGRGVGLDVVRNNVQRLNGVIEVETEAGAGTRFLVKIPLTLAMVQVLLTGCGHELYAIPASAVLESVRADELEALDIDGRAHVLYQGAPLPFVRLREYFAVPPAGPSGRREYLVVLAAANLRAGLVVDQLRGQQEIVIKPLGPHLDGTSGVAGAVTLDDGRVCLVLDVADVVEELAGLRQPVALEGPA